ncbi:solute:sodium symporter family transporter [Fulvitalea axinellae]|uniref:Solute:sodium symporter family transporter n=1 Tax=Fulvitalea axinellae TaxID=1182444 RepID=A0AAU9CWC8_9BACT|nr:solute:sodium symporter family transporter [Fulvitalea axinellae]
MLSSWVFIAVLVGYFGLLVVVAKLTSKGADDKSFFTADRKSPWYLVAFGMIGAALSGVTFISVPGEVGNSNLSYFQLLLGNVVGYWLVAFGLIPLYYKRNVVSVYEYLRDRFGAGSYKTGSAFFLLSQLIGASFRLYLAALVLQLFFFDGWGVPFPMTVALALVLIWLYTFRGGIKTIVWTDTLQTLCMLLAVGSCVYWVMDDLGSEWPGLAGFLEAHPNGNAVVTDWQDKRFFLKEFFAGVFLAVVMVGLDQNMMQKSLTCKNSKESKRNMVAFSLSFLAVSSLFLFLGLLLYSYMAKHGIELPNRSDELFPYLALNHFGGLTSVLFLLGVTAAAYSSADSSLTALTTSFCVDILGGKKTYGENTRRYVHIGFTVAAFATIMLFWSMNDQSVVRSVFKVAGYTYGPLLGLFAYGLFRKKAIRDAWVPVVCLLSPVLTYFVNANSEAWLFGYRFGHELLLLNGLLTFVALECISLGKPETVNEKKIKIGQGN